MPQLGFRNYVFAVIFVAQQARYELLGFALDSKSQFSKPIGLDASFRASLPFLSRLVLEADLRSALPRSWKGMEVETISPRSQHG